MTIREEIRRLAEEAALSIVAITPTVNQRIIESAILEGVKLVLKLEPIEAMITAGERSTAKPLNRNVCRLAYRAMIRELLKELE
jgi:hypothetical protein